MEDVEDLVDLEDVYVDRMIDAEKVVATNRRARFEYHLEDTYEAGVVLTGTEVKSLRAGRASMADAFARIENGEVWLYHLHIPPYEAGNIFNHDPLRKRKLLLHHGEIRRLFGKAQVKGYTLVPLRLYFKHGIAKVELAVARGKRQYDKRAAIEKREAQRRMEHALRRRR